MQFNQLVLTAITFCLLAFYSCTGSKNNSKTSPEDKFLGIWEIKTIEKGGRTIDMRSIAGECYMDFSKNIKKSEDKKTKTTYKFRMEMGGQDRIFDYRVMNDSVKFVQVKNWNDMKIVSFGKEETKLDQIVDGDIIRYNLYPRPDLDAAKKKAEKEAANKAAGK
jgi:hypothetical protein